MPGLRKTTGIKQRALVGRLLALLKIDSPSRREGAFAAYVGGALDEIGILHSTDDAARKIGGETGNIIARLPGNADAPPLLINAHLDTVVNATGVKPRISAGVIRPGSGTALGADDKAAVAQILEVLRVLLAEGRPRPPLEIVFTVAEEVGLSGVRALNPKLLKAKLGITLDADGPVGRAVIGAPGHALLKATIKGRAAHAGVAPEKGVNAIQIAAQAISRMKLGRLDEETTANIGVISGGTAMNVVPARCELTGEARSHDEGKLTRQIEEMIFHLHQAAAEGGGSLEVEVEREFAAFRLSEQAPPLRLARAAARRIGLRLKPFLSGGGSDSSTFNELGIPTASLSVGYLNPHSEQEQIAVSQLVRGAEFLLAVIEEAAQRRLSP